MSRPSLIFARSPIQYLGSNIWRAAVNYVTDGDTIWVERDAGGRDVQLMELRVTGKDWKGFNAAERFTEQGKLITARVKELIQPGTIIRIETAKDVEKYGRWLSPVLIPLESIPDKYHDGPLAGSFKGPALMYNYSGADYLQEEPGNDVPYLSLAEHLNRNFPGAVWQTY